MRLPRGHSEVNLAFLGGGRRVLASQTADVVEQDLADRGLVRSATFPAVPPTVRIDPKVISDAAGQ